MLCPASDFCATSLYVSVCHMCWSVCLCVGCDEVCVPVGLCVGGGSHVVECVSLPACVCMSVQCVCVCVCV